MTELAPLLEAKEKLLGSCAPLENCLKLKNQQSLLDLLLFVLHVHLHFLFRSCSLPVFPTRVLWRPGSKKSWWPRVCWILRRDLDQVGMLRTKSWLSYRRGKQS